MNLTSFSPSEIAEIIDARIIGEQNQELSIKHLLIDSRKVTFPFDSLFFAIKGAQHDGHDFVEDAYRQGVRFFVVSNLKKLSIRSDGVYLLVDDALTALQKLGSYKRHLFHLPVIGITGSNGKTIIKEWLFQLLHPRFNIVRSPRSYNSQVGVPLSLWEIDAGHDLGVFEAGISLMGEMEKIAPLIDCGLGVFSNIGPAHQEGFPSVEEKVRQKMKLFEKAERIIYCKDYALIEEEMSKLPKERLFSWSFNQKADLQVEILPSGNLDEAVELLGIVGERSSQITLPFGDKVSIENAIHCWAVMLYLDLPQEYIKARMKLLEPVGMRMEFKAGANNCLLLNDSYNSDLYSLSIAIDLLAHQCGRKSKVLILSDILQSGFDPVALYKRIAKVIVEKGIQKLIGVGKDIPLVRQYLSDQLETRFYPNTEALLEELSTSWFHNEGILIKGSRAFRFERIANRLSYQAHNTYLEVDLDAAARNVRIFRRLLKPSKMLMVMVKAEAYGSGSLEMARLLEFHRTDYLAVAYADEGVRLREAGIKLPILILNPDESSFEHIIHHQLEPEIYSMDLLKRWNNYLADNKRVPPIQLKLDTGMHRLGFMEEDLPELIRFLKTHPHIIVKGIFSHLASSGNPKDDSFTLKQVHDYRKMYEQISQALGYRPLRHILNSSGICRFPQYQMDMVRLGIGLHGIGGSKLLPEPLHVVERLKTHISQLKKINAGETVGYNRNGVLNKKATIAIAAIGYADGLPRLAGNGRYSLMVKGALAPIVGDVCMDMCMLDVTDIQDVQVGDPVEVFGENIRIEKLAECAKTIPYEILTNISQRVKKVYVSE